ncbi:hypothetical protein [Streptomyces spongiae]|uniref:Uncharacterized protein n=1 Tax=Streptomyces spongiae TaxID=565072 RepID=A0A5N8XQ12_9ACTN|nr:hypothetical protein [Streptomyces spongiae]MPY61048.1 hypothetical protein [Streptomyces spongiae]
MSRTTPNRRYANRPLSVLALVALAAGFEGLDLERLRVGAERIGRLCDPTRSLGSATAMTRTVISAAGRGHAGG